MLASEKWRIASSELPHAGLKNENRDALWERGLVFTTTRGCGDTGRRLCNRYVCGCVRTGQKVVMSSLSKRLGFTL